MRRLFCIALLCLTLCGCCRCDRGGCACESQISGETISEETREETLPETTQSPEPVSRPGYTVCRTQVYTLPGGEGKVIGELEPHTEVALLSLEGEWYRLKLAEGEGLLPAEHVREMATEANGYLVVIDPGHQRYGNSEKEPDGPGSDTMKARVTTGTQGRTTGLAEYELNLQVGLKLRRELENRGYTVIMTRETNDVDLSNSQRAAIANEAGADAFIRLHANGSENSGVSGAMTICQTAANPYNGDLYAQSRALSDCVLDAMVAAAGCGKQYVWETDTMSGINWCQVPVTILEMGYMTNPEEDTLLATEDYQYKMVQGIANGLDAFFAR